MYMYIRTGDWMDICSGLHVVMSRVRTLSAAVSCVAAARPRSRGSGGECEHILDGVFMHMFEVLFMDALDAVFMPTLNSALMHIFNVILMHVLDGAFMHILNLAFMHI